MPKKQHRWRPGTVALREIRQHQKSTARLLPKASFERVVREILSDIKSDCRLQSEAVEALQEGAEEHLVEILRVAQKYALHGKRITILPDDFNLARDEVLAAQ